MSPFLTTAEEELSRLKHKMYRENQVELTTREIDGLRVAYWLRFKGFAVEVIADPVACVRLTAEDYRAYLQEEIARKFADAVAAHVRDAFIAAQRMRTAE